MAKFFTILTSANSVPVVTMNADLITLVHEGGVGTGSANNKNMTVHFNNGEASGEFVTFQTNKAGDGSKLVDILSEYLWKQGNIKQPQFVEYGDIVITQVIKDTP
jgi:hypothetical protein